MHALRRTASWRRTWLVIAVMGCTAAVAACGSSGKGSSHAKTRAGSFLAFSKCMRAHGVPNFPDPSGQGGINIGSNINPASPSFEAAQATCKKKLPGGGPPAHPSEQQKEQLFAMAECMRAHGVTGFPDPVTRTAPPSNMQAYSLFEAIGNLWLLVPSTINPNSPAFKHASKACKFR